MGIIYFDNSATTKPHREVIDEVVLCMEEFYANPSSAHSLGYKAEKKIKLAKENVAKLINSSWQEIIFNSGGSEGNNTAILGLLNKGDHIITSVIEHPSVRQVIQKLEKQGMEVTYLEVDKNGLIDLNKLREAIKKNTKLVTIMYVNNEIGSIQRVEDIIRIVHEESPRAKVHLDAVQAVGKIKIDVKVLGVDMVSLSAHKIHGPKGIGALYIKKGLIIKPFIEGGGQENGLRSGTENLPGASGFGVAANISSENISRNIIQVKALKTYFIDKLCTIEGVIINSPVDEEHIDNILNVSFEGVRGEVLLHSLEDYGIYVSTGSACSAKKGTKENYVLPAIGVKKELIDGTIRFSFSYLNTHEEVDSTIDALKKILPFLRRLKK